MAFTYALYPNKMLKEKSSYRALIKDRRHYSFDEIIERVAIRKQGLTEAEIEGILQLFMEEVSDILEEGDSVTTPLFKAQCSIAGLFDGATDSFSGNRHQVKVNLSPGSLLRQMVSRATPRKTESGFPKPVINQVTDLTTASINSALTPGGPLIIKGARLTFDADDPEQGIFFVNKTGPSFRVSSLLQNTFSQMILLVPADLPPGTYQLQVKSSLKTGTVRTEEFSYLLEVGS